MKPIERPADLKAYYQDPVVVEEYLRRRIAQPLNGLLHQKQICFLNRVVSELAPQTVLEVAPGPARLTAALIAVPRGVALDFSPAMLRAARQRTAAAGRRWHFVRGDAFHLPVASESVDLVFSLRLVHHFGIEDRRRIYAEFRRVLRRGGGLIVDAQNRIVRPADHVSKQAVFDALYSAPELRGELERAGFAVRRMEGIIHHHTTQRALNRLRVAGLDRLARWLIATLERVPSRNPSTWMVLCARG